VTVRVRVLADDETPAALAAQIRDLLADAFRDGFSEEDWEHTRGGWRVVALDGGEALSHAAVVPRTVRVDDRPFRAGYVEGVATTPSRARQGLGSQVMVEATHLVAARFEMGVLSTSAHVFYERLGWERWTGPTFVRDAGRLVRTADEDDGIMVVRHGPSGGVDLGGSIACDRRAGDDW
jgi:aminoglycoside 2'-N-acetyltransferase I